MANRVRTHTRKTASGKTARVQQHSRKGKPRKGLVSPRHAWELLKRAHRASKRKKTILALVLGGLGVGELVAFLVLDTTALLFTTIAVLFTLGAGLTAMATGRE